jgi:very-short-patch-repair endonuclease
LYDQRRSDVLLHAGIRIIRFSDVDVLKHRDAVREKIWRELTEPDHLKPPPP